MTQLIIKGKPFKIPERLKQKLDNILLIRKKKWDYLIIVDGKERSGKSTLAQICAYYLTNGNFSINNMSLGSSDVLEKLEKLPDFSVLIMDEGSLTLSAKDWATKGQRQLVKVLNVIGQKSMVLIVVLPSFFDLNKYVAIDRSRFLLHVYTDEVMNRGRVAYFGEKRKRMLYILGKKTMNSYAAPQSDFNTTFGEFEPLGKEYMELKRKSLMEALQTEEGGKIRRNNEALKENRVAIWARMKENNPNLSKKELAAIMGVSMRTIDIWKAEIRAKPLEIGV